MKIRKFYNQLPLLFLISLIFVPLFGFHSVLIKAESNSTSQTVYQADAKSTMGYEEVFSELNHSTLDSGKIWSDKSVFPKSGDKTQVEVEGNLLEFEDDFLEVLSVIGSTHEIEYPGSEPRDYVLLLDLSSSMATPDERGYRISQAVRAINSMAEKIIQNHPDNRIGIVCFGMLARVLAELDHYSEFELSETVSVNGFIKNITINFNARKSSGQTLTKQLTNTKKDVYSYTNIRDAFTLGFSQFTENPTSNDPYLILISNGYSTTFNVQTLFEDTIVEEVEDSSNLYVIEGFSEAEDVSVLVTLLNGAYQKARITKKLQKDLKVFALGFDVSEEEREGLKQYLDPENFFKGHPDSIIFTWWNKWANEDNPMTLPLKDTSIQSHSGFYADLPENYTVPEFKEKDGVMKSDIITNFNYIDQYYEISHESIESLLSEFVEKKSIPAFHPLNPEENHGSDGSGAFTFYDPIGEGFKIGELKGLSLFGCFYPVIENSQNEEIPKLREYRLLDPNSEMREIINPAYSEKAAFSLDEIKIQIFSESYNSETLKLTLPENALPVIKASIALSQYPDISGHRQITSYQVSNRESFSRPLRFFYTLRKTDDARPLQAPGFSRTNRYSSRENSMGLSYGDTCLTFTPSSENPYYFIRENEKIYPSDSGIIGEDLLFPEWSEEIIASQGIYYIKKSYYDSLNGLSQIMQPVTSHRVSSDETSSPLGKNYYQFHPEDTQLKLENLTDSAETIIHAESDPDTGLVSHFLGNNGKLSYYPATLAEKTSNLVLKKYQSVNNEEFTSKTIEVSSGDTITYLLVLENIGETKAEKIRIWDTIPEGLEYISGSASTNGTVQNRKLTWEIPILNPGERVTLNFKVKTPQKDTTTSWENSAFFQEKRQLRPEYSNKVVSIIKPSKLTVEKLQSVNGDTITKSLESIRTGDALTYFLTIYNRGPGRAKNVTISDTVPPGLTLLKESITNSGIITNNEIKWNIAQINPYEHINLSFSTIVNNGNETKFYNMAILKEEISGKSLFSNTVLAVKSEESMKPLSLSSVTIEKKQSVNNGIFSREVQDIRSGDSVSYLITVNNDTDSELRNVQINDNLPPGLEIDLTSISPGGVFFGDKIVWTINRLNPGDKRDVSFRMSIANEIPVTVYKNSAQLTHSESFNPLESNEVALRRLMPEVALRKSQSVNTLPATQDPIEVTSRDQITYYLTVENTSPVLSLKNLKVVDPVDSSLIIHRTSISGNGIYENGSVVWSIPVLEPEEILILYFAVSIPNGKTSGSWSNEAKIFINESLIAESNTVLANQSSLSPLSLSEPHTGPKVKPDSLKKTDSPGKTPETGLQNSIKMTLIILLCALGLFIPHVDRFLLKGRK